MIDANDNLTTALTLTETPAVADPRGLTMIQMDQVEALPQVRTESGWDDKSLSELAESIKTLGLLQLPLLRWDAMRGKFLVIAGHRRIEAMRRAGFPGFYAITGEADQQQAHLMQLTENIHREQLTTKETAYALRTLSDQGKTLAQIAAMVNKSKPWVSKHLSVTHPDFGSYAREKFERCEVEDLEILNSLSQAEKAIDSKNAEASDEVEWIIGATWIKQRCEGSWSRTTAAKLAKEAKTYQLPALKEEESEESEEGQAKMTTPIRETLETVINELERLEGNGELVSLQNMAVSLLDAMLKAEPSDELTTRYIKLAGKLTN